MSCSFPDRFHLIVEINAHACVDAFFNRNRSGILHLMPSGADIDSYTLTITEPDYGSAKASVRQAGYPPTRVGRALGYLAFNDLFAREAIFSLLRSVVSEIDTNR